MNDIDRCARPYSLPVKALLGMGHYFLGARCFQYQRPEHIAAYQLSRLRHVVAVASNRIPFYRRRFREIGFEPGDLRSLDDLTRLPILTKHDLRRHFMELFDPSQLHRAVLLQTSGTTGEPTRFLLPRQQTVLELAYHWRFWLWAGYRPGARVAAFRHYAPSAGEPISRYELSSNTLFFSVHDMYEARLEEYVRQFNRFRPWVVRGYPSSLYIFARFALERGLTLHSPRAVLTASETLLPQYRQTIEQTMGPVFDEYGTNERVLTAFQCEHRQEYHMSAEAGIAEFLELSDATPSAEGAKSLVLTGLVNTIMPLIRYEVGDLAIPGTGACACGRGLPTIKSILGRTDDLLRTAEGKSITPIRFYTVFERFPQIDQFQVIQTRDDHIEVRIVPNCAFTGEAHQQLMLQLGRVVGHVALDVRPVPRIEATPAGKRRNVISHVTPR